MMDNRLAVLILGLGFCRSGCAFLPLPDLTVESAREGIVNDKRLVGI